MNKEMGGHLGREVKVELFLRYVCVFALYKWVSL